MSRWEKKKAIAIFTIVMLMSVTIQAQNGPPANVPAGGGGLFWKLSGNDNAGADNFIGTLNLSDFIAKTNGTERFRILGSSGYFGIGTAAPLSLFHVSNGTVLFEGNTGSTPVSGGGTRLMWIPSKIAFRAGTVSASQWDNANIGLGSFAMGINAIASGLGSISLGTNTTASGQFSTAIGSGSQATGSFSMSIGSNTLADGSFSMALGSGSRSQGQFSIAIGESGTNSQGQFSYAQGSNAKATGSFSHAWGSSVQAIGDFSFAIGNNSTASANFSFATGNSVTSSGQAAFATGNQVTAAGSSSFATGSQVTTQGTNAFATGYQASANSSCSFAFGHSVTANESCAMVLGKGADNANRLINNSPNSLMIGFNSDLPTLFIGSSQGTGTTGNVGIGGITNPTEKLEVNGNIKATGSLNIAGITTLNKIITPHISSPDSIINFGDSTLQFLTSQNRIQGDQNSALKGVGIGVAATAKGISSLALGYSTSAPADYSIAIGSGISGAQKFINTIPNSLMIGFNADVPSIFVAPGTAGQAGSVGINTTTPGANYENGNDDPAIVKLDVNGHARFGTGNTNYLRLGYNGANAIMDNFGTGNLLINYYSGKDVVIGKLDHIDGPSDLFVTGKVGVGRESGDTKLTVGIGTDSEKSFSIFNTATQKENFLVFGDGVVMARDIIITQNTFAHPDYVFQKNYKLMSLADLRKFIATNQHLPGIPSAQEVSESGGLSVGMLQTKLLEKVEEQTLYILSLEERIAKLEAMMKEMVKQ